MIPKEQICILADRMVEWQTPYGRLDTKKCPFVSTETFVTSLNFHSPSFMAVGLYRAYEATGDIRYKEAADRYVAGYFACLRDPTNKADHYTKTWIKLTEENNGPLSAERHRWAVNILQWAFMHGMALAGYRWFRKHNPDELALESMASALYEWMQYWRWDEGSYYRNGYGSLKYGTIDNGTSDDCCHMGRGLMAYHAVTGREDVLADAERLAGYYLTEAEPGTYKGCWSSSAGTWVVAPTTAIIFEDSVPKKCCDVCWGFSSMGVIEYLSELAAATQDEKLRRRIAEKCASSMRWQFDACQFEDGAIGVFERDDKWLGMTAGAVMSYIRVRDAGFLNSVDIEKYGQQAKAASDWVIRHVTPEGIDAGGYFRITGRTEPTPPDNLAWLFGITLQCLSTMDKL